MSVLVRGYVHNKARVAKAVVRCIPQRQRLHDRQPVPQTVRLGGHSLHPRDPNGKYRPGWKTANVWASYSANMRVIQLADIHSGMGIGLRAAIIAGWVDVEISIMSPFLSIPVSITYCPRSWVTRSQRIFVYRAGLQFGNQFGDTPTRGC